MSTLWLERDSNMNLAKFEQGYELTNPEAGSDTHLEDHTWLAYASIAGMEMIRYEATKRESDWVGSESFGGQPSSGEIDISNDTIDMILTDQAGVTAIIEVDSNPGRRLSSEYAVGEKIVMVGGFPIKYSINSLLSQITSVDEVVVELTDKVDTLTARLEALENPA